LKHQLKTDRLGVNVWPYASAMLDESSQVNIREYVKEFFVPLLKYAYKSAERRDIRYHCVDCRLPRTDTA